MRRTAIIVALVAGVLLPVTRAQAQPDPTGQCFCDADGKVGIAQLIRAVNIALGTADCPSAASCGCCACDFGGGDVECGNGDIDCAECIGLGGVQAPTCSICEGTCSAAATLCQNNPQHCAMGAVGQCNCCACDFGGGDIQCGNSDVDCAECISDGGAPASDCSICSGECAQGEVLCMNNPQQCTMSTAAASSAQAHSTPRYSHAAAPKSHYPGKGG